MNTIEIKGLRKTYLNGKIELHAVNGIDLDIHEGEFTAIVGPSGSGKTTLLNLIGGLETPSAGVIQIDGKDIGQLTKGELFDFRLNNIGFVFQAYNLVPVLSALENVEFILQLQGVSSGKRKEESIKVLEAVGLGDRLNSRPSELSGGQQQRVAVGRALVSKPKFILGR